MPRRRPPQPPTPDNLPAIPQGATKKAYYPAGNLVYYLQSPDDGEWKRGEISDETTSTSLHIVIDEATRYTYNVRVEYIRERPSWAPATVPLANHEYQPDHPDENEYDTTTDQASSSAAQGGDTGHARTDSTDSDELGWSQKRYQQETGSIDELADTLHETHIGGSSITAWSEWKWNKERQQWGRYRMSYDKHEYEWRGPDSSSSNPKESTTTLWNEWEWIEEHQQWRRYRMSHGGYEYEWKAPDSSTSSTSKSEESTTAWSEWEWIEEQQQWRCYRVSHGVYEYQWRAPESEKVKGMDSSHKGKGKKGKK